MKKKLIFITLMVSLLVCIFALSASAATIYRDESGAELFRYTDADSNFDFDSYEGSFAKEDADGNAITWYITATATENGDTIHTVKSLKTLGEAGSINGNGAYSFTSPVTNKNTVSINFPDDSGIKSFAFNSFGGHNSRKNGTADSLYNNILFVYCPNTLTTFAQGPFQETSVIVVELDDETPINNIPQNFAHEARNLEKINIPASVATINGSTSGNGTPFYRNYSLTEVRFASNNTVTKMTGATFQECTALTSVTLPVSVKEIGERAFEGCTNLTTVRLGASLQKTTGVSVFRLCPNLRVYYIPNTFTTVNLHTFTHDSGNGPADTVFFFAGTQEQFNTFYNAAVSGGRNERVTSGYKEEYVVEWDSTQPDSYYTNLATTAGHKVYVINYGVCEAFYGGIHVLDPEKSNACAGICAQCGELKQSASPVHEWLTTITYADFSMAGIKITKCTHDNCTKNTNPDSTEVNPIFVYVGFSADKNDVSQFCIGYRIDQDALKAYKEANPDVAIGYGLTATAIATTNAPIGTDGERVSNKVVQAKLSTLENAEEIMSIDLVIKGDFTNSTNANAQLGMAMYITRTEIVEGSAQTTVSYIGSTGEAPTIETVTFAEKFPDLAPKAE